MFDVEDQYWWYAGLRDLLASYLRELKASKRRPVLLDAGCGTGATLSMLQSYGPAFGVDLSSDALGFCVKRGLKELTKASVLRLPFQSGQFDCVVSMDVLYHQAVSDDLSAVKEFHRVLADGGKLLLNLPAFEFLRSEHDRAIHTARRYQLGQVNELLKTAGFTVEKITYRNSLVFPLVLGVRLFRRQKSDSSVPRSDLERMPRPINRVLTGILKLENTVLRRINFPVGSSIFCVAAKASGTLPKKN
jgi:SAM-dependent methyltransferase